MRFIQRNGCDESTYSWSRNIQWSGLGVSEFFFSSSWTDMSSTPQSTAWSMNEYYSYSWINSIEFSTCIK